MSAPSLRSRVGRLKWLVSTLTFAELAMAVRVMRESRHVRERRLQAARAAWTGRLVFVCYGNIMRSAFATAYVQRARPSLAHRISGAGTHARNGKAAEPVARDVASSLGIDLSLHAATKLSDAGAGPGDLLICMDFANAARTMRTPGVDPSSVFMIGDLSGQQRDIADPYGNGTLASQAAFARIVSCCEQWIVYLEGARGEPD